MGHVTIFFFEEHLLSFLKSELRLYDANSFPCRLEI